MNLEELLEQARKELEDQVGKKIGEQWDDESALEELTKQWRDAVKWAEKCDRESFMAFTVSLALLHRMPKENAVEATKDWLDEMPPEAAKSLVRLAIVAIRTIAAAKVIEMSPEFGKSVDELVAEMLRRMAD